MNIRKRVVTDHSIPSAPKDEEFLEMKTQILERRKEIDIHNDAVDLEKQQIEKSLLERKEKGKGRSIVKSFRKKYRFSKKK